MNKRKMGFEKIKVEKKRKLNSQSLVEFTTDKIENLSNTNDYVEKYSQPIYLTVPNNLDSSMTNKLCYDKVQNEENQSGCINQILTTNSQTDEVKLSNANVPDDVDDSIKNCFLEQSVTKSSILMVNNMPEEKGLSTSNVQHLSQSYYSANSRNLCQNSLIIGNIIEDDCNSFISLESNEVKKRNLISKEDNKTFVNDISEINAQPKQTFPSQNNIDCSRDLRLPHAAYNESKQHPIIIGTSYIDPWSVPELHLESIEIEMIVGKATNNVKKKKSRLKREKIKIIPLNNSSTPKMFRKQFKTRQCPVEGKPTVNNDVEMLDLYKPRVIRPTLMMDNCLPLDIISAPCMEYIEDHVDRCAIGEKSLYFNKILNDMTFCESFLQTDVSNEENSFHDLLGVNFFGTGIDISAEDATKTEIKEEVITCPTCCLKIDPALNSVINLGIIRKSMSYCKCNFQCYRNNSKKICQQFRKVEDSKLIFMPCDHHSQTLEQNSYGDTPNYTILDDKCQLQSSISIEMSECNLTKPERCSCCEKYGNIHKNVEYFEDIVAENDVFPSLHFNCECSMFNMGDSNLHNDLVPNETFNLKSSSLKIEQDSLLNEKCNISNSSSTLYKNMLTKSTNENDEMINTFKSLSSEKNNLKSIQKQDTKEKDFKFENSNLNRSLAKWKGSLQLQSAIKKKVLNRMKDPLLAIQRKMLLNPYKSLIDTGWAVTNGNPSINYIFDYDCPTVIPFKLINSYCDSAYDLISWNFANCVVESKIRNKTETPIRKYKSGQSIKKVKKIYNYCAKYAEEFRTKSRPINSIYKLEAEKCNSKSSSFDKYFGSLLNRIPRVGDDGKDISKVTNNSSSSKLQSYKKSIGKHSPVYDKLEPSNIRVADGKSLVHNNLYDPIVANMDSIKVSEKSPITLPTAISKSKFNSSSKMLTSQSMSKPLATISSEGLCKKKKKKVRCDKLAHSIFSGLIANTDREIPSSVCILLNKKLFVYNRNYEL